jgi:hypothetical protein
MDRGTLRWILLIAALILAGLWLFTVLLSDPSVAWVPPGSVLTLAVAVAL